MDRYTSVHENINGPGDARPTAEQILKDGDLIGNLTGKTILITVWITARNKTKGEEVAKSISNDGKPYPAVKVVEIDLSDLESVRQGAKTFLDECPELNILVTNAGVMACPESRSAQNFELQFATNHLAHFLLFQLLKPALLSATTSSFPSRVVSLRSAGHRGSSIHTSNYNLENGAYKPFVAYGQSKTANILMANEIERRYGARGLHAGSVHPGIIFETGISRHQEGEADGLKERLTQADERTTKVMKSTGQGAATQVWAAVAKALEGKGGLYLEDCQVSRKAEKKEGAPSYFGHEDYIYDVELAGRLWRDSCEMVGVEDRD